jgi:predicted transcriptional regulator
MNNSIKTIAPIVPVHAEQFLTKEEARILTIARQPSNKANPAVTAQLAAYSFAEDLEDIHAAAKTNYERREINHRAELHNAYRQQAKQLKLLALQTLSNLIG